MDATWDLYVFYGNSNKDYALEAVKNIYKRRVFTIPVGADNLNADEYNRLFKTKDFWAKIQAENILIFQTDVALCSNSVNNIYDYINFDYIGCSINDKTIGNKNVPEWWAGENFYGVGGMSFRKKTFTLNCLDNLSPNDSSAEDVFYSNCVAKSKNKPTSAYQIANFCTQNKYTHKSFGAHRTEILKKESTDRYYDFAKYCPEIIAINQ